MEYVKREKIRQQRLQKKRKQRLATLLAVAGVILVVVALIGLPSLIDKYRPAGEYVSITPQAYPFEDGRTLGDPNALVVVEVFSDFQCSHCKNFATITETQLFETEYFKNGQVYYIARQYPFMDNTSAIKSSDQAANASMCAAEQDRFWDYRAMLFANQNPSNATAFSDRRLIAFAEALGLDTTAFNRCFDDNAYAADIQADIDRATLLSVSGTPTVFINGEKLGVGKLVPSYDEIITAIETALSLQ
jgi:protein-disulfide isomerase